MNYNVEDVFVTTGVPKVTFVEPKEYNELLVAIRTKGKGVVIEGPSGIGKTTSVNSILEVLNLKSTCKFLSARRNKDIDKIEEVAEGDFSGVVVIDDFHRLPVEIREKISNTMKYLADESDENRKIIIIGINRVGDSLVHFSPDLNNRISTIRFESNSDEKIEELILKGERALNIIIENKEQLIAKSYGSFHIAQLMCQKACILQGIKNSQIDLIKIVFSYAKITDLLSEEFSRSYFNVAKNFSSGPRLRKEGRAPYLHILKWLAESDTWSIMLAVEIKKHPDLKASVSQIIDKGYLSNFLEKNGELSDYIHFDPTTEILSAEDPKFVFYLKTLNWNVFAKKIGYLSLIEKPKYDFAISFAGSQREIAEKLFKKLIKHEVSVFYDKNEQADILSEDIEEYLYRIYNSEAVFVIALMSKDYPRRVWTKFESKAFKERLGENAVVPVWFSNAGEAVFDESRKVGGFDFNVDGNKEAQINDLVEILLKKIANYKLNL